MAGGRRRVSSSTVATFDLTHIPLMNETKILRPLASNSENSNDWPCFVLTDAVILHKDGKRLANPLLIDTDGPYIVRGKLEVEKEQRHLLTSQVNSAYIEIQASWLYSIGYNPVVLWVSGATGWFEIVPSLQYEAMYNEIREAINLYYVVMVACEAQMEYANEYAAASKSRKKKMRPPEPMSLDHLFLKYAVAVGDGIYHHEVEERCHKWASFLINHFPKESDFDWTGTLFYEWMIQEHPEIQKRRQKGAGLPSTTTTASKQLTPAMDHAVPIPRPERSWTRSVVTSHTRDTEDVEMQEATAAAVSSPAKSVRRTRGARTESHAPSQSPRARATNIVPPPEMDSSPERTTNSHPDEGSGSVIDLLLELLQEIATETGDLQRIKRKSVQSKIYAKCKIRDYKVPHEIIGYYSKQILQKLPSKWKRAPFYNELKEAASQPDMPLKFITVEDILPQLRRRQQNRVAATNPSTLPASPRADIRARVRRDSPPESSDLDEDSREGSRHARTPAAARRAGKVGGLRLSTASKKRTVWERDEEPESYRARKSAKSSHLPTDDEDAADDVHEPSDEATAWDEDEDPDGLPVRPPKDAVRVVVHAEKIPSMSPSGPNGTWVCDQEDCFFVVRSAEEEAGKALIQQHFRDHEAQAGMVDLAVSEARRGHMSINHLLAKIQALGKKTAVSERGTLDGEILAAPIKRRLPI